jgi:hypothetical protein
MEVRQVRGKECDVNYGKKLHLAIFQLCGESCSFRKFSFARYSSSLGVVGCFCVIDRRRPCLSLWRRIRSSRRLPSGNPIRVRARPSMYASYCAPCHSASGKGGGPAGSEFKVAPANLAPLTKNNHGEFPSSHLWANLARPLRRMVRAICRYGAPCSGRWIRMIR